MKLTTELKVTNHLVLQCNSEVYLMQAVMSFHKTKWQLWIKKQSLDHALRMCAYCLTVTLQIVVDLCSMTMMRCEMSCCSPACKCIREESKVGVDMPCYVWSIWFRNTSFRLTFLFEDGLVGLGWFFVLFCFLNKIQGNTEKYARHC